MTAPDLSGVPLEQLAWALADAMERHSVAFGEARNAETEAGHFRAELARRLTVGEVVMVDDDTCVVMEPPKPVGRRAVDRDAIDRHAETLGPLGLGPAPDPRPRDPRYPTLAELERRQAVLEAYGLSLDELITVPPLGEPEVVIRALERAS